MCINVFDGEKNINKENLCVVSVLSLSICLDIPVVEVSLKMLKKKVFLLL